jgi:peptide deformylase
MAPYTIRVFGDPVLKQRASEIDDIDGTVARLVEDMFSTLYDTESGIGLAAPQVGVQKRIFVYDLDDTPVTLINPRIVESSGEWEYNEGCLSLPDLYFPIVRPKEVHLVAHDLDGNEISIEADELLARLFQHELDHLDGVLMLDRLEDDLRKQALGILRERAQAAAAPEPEPRRGLSLRLR